MQKKLMEIWKQIQGFKPIYQVSSTGRIRSIERNTNDNGGVLHRKERILRVSVSRLGYHIAYLYDVNGRKRTIPVHQIVARAFISNPENKPEIDHIDGDKSNNRPENLRWVTHKENCSNPVTAQKQKKYIEESAKHRRAILAFDLNGKFVGEWPTLTKAAKETGTCRHSISYAANGKYKTANNLIWRYDG